MKRIKLISSIIGVRIMIYIGIVVLPVGCNDAKKTTDENQIQIQNEIKKRNEAIEQQNEFIHNAIKAEIVSIQPSTIELGVILKVRISNISDQDIRAFQGTAHFWNVFHEYICEYSLSYENNLKSRTSNLLSFKLDISPYNENDPCYSLREKAVNNIIFTFNPTKILLENGQLMKIEQPISSK